jgi:hypothetical protein
VHRPQAVLVGACDRVDPEPRIQIDWQALVLDVLRKVGRTGTLHVEALVAVLADQIVGNWMPAVGELPKFLP